MSADKPRERLRIAVQKSGRLADASQDLLARCGLKFRQSRDKLFCFGENHAIDLLLVRDDDIPGLIAQGVCDLGVVGRNVLAEQILAASASGAPPARELYALGFGRCRLAIAVGQDAEYTNAQSLAGMRIATTYPALLGDWLQRNGVDAQAVVLSGSVEIAPRLGTADAICDLVSSGATLAANQLREVAMVLESEAVLIGAETIPADERGELRELLLRRIDGVIQVRESKLVLLHAARSALPAITRLLPNGQEPTITSVEGSADNVSLQALCYGSITWQHLEEMKRAGASRLLVLPVEKMLA
jgi:ATP phosphoribosyltransferase